MLPDPDLFAINPAARLHVETTAAGTPILVVDDFYADPHGVRALALAGRYDASLAYYPGLHSDIGKGALDGMFATLCKMLTLLGDVRARPEYFRSDFSIVTTPAAQMLAKQKHPHIDPAPLAGLVYLNPDFAIGTCFFRHIPLDLAVIRTPEEGLAYQQWMESFGEQTQPGTYAVGEDGVWQRLHAVAGVFNRLVLYSGNAFHSIDMRDVEANPTLDKARLTQRLFVGRLDNLNPAT